MISLFTRSIARKVGLPSLDRILKEHINYCEADDSNVEKPATSGTKIETAWNSPPESEPSKAD